MFNVSIADSDDDTVFEDDSDEESDNVSPRYCKFVYACECFIHLQVASFPNMEFYLALMDFSDRGLMLNFLVFLGW